jgi:hypothetical protein
MIDNHSHGSVTSLCGGLRHPSVLCPHVFRPPGIPAQRNLLELRPCVKLLHPIRFHLRFLLFYRPPFRILSVRRYRLSCQGLRQLKKTENRTVEISRRLPSISITAFLSQFPRICQGSKLSLKTKPKIKPKITKYTPASIAFLKKRVYDSGKAYRNCFYCLSDSTSARPVKR